MDKKKRPGKEAQRVKSLPKESKWEGRATGGIITGVKLGIKEKRQKKGEEKGCMERKVYMVENNDNIQ
jgi:hypothetical protein